MSHEAWPAFSIFEESRSVMPLNVSEKCVLYMSATARASLKHVWLRHAFHHSIGVHDLTVPACNGRHARTTMVLT